MIRRFFKKLGGQTKKFESLLKKYNISTYHLNTNRKNSARGFLVGLFWGFIPMPAQMVGVMLTAPLMRFNIPIALATVWLSNPLTYPPLWYAEYYAGNILLGNSNNLNFELTMEWFSAHWDEIVLPLYVGTLFFSTVVAFLLYLGFNLLWRSSVLKEKTIR